MFKHLGLAALSASAVAMAFIACGGDGTGTDISCVTDADCTEANTICHPGALVCVQTCTSGADCPDSAKTCGAVSSTDDRQICQCATDTLCAQGDLGTGAVCQEAWSVCTNACTGDTDCPTGFECDTATGQCTDGGAGSCDPACGAGQTCDTSGATPTCVAATCNAADPQPSTCAAGTFCSSGTCQAPPAPTCSNITNLNPAGGWDPRTWDPTNAAHNGPVIYSIGKGPNTTFMCGAGSSVIQAEIKAYRTDKDFPADKSALGGFFYALVNGNRLDATNSVRPSDYIPNGREATIRVNFCSDPAESQIQVGLYFTNGNAICGTIQR